MSENTGNAARRLAGKVAVVTGASKGIGAGIAKGLAGAGASVVVNYSSSREGAEKVVAAIVGDGGRAVEVQADVSKADDVRRLFAEAKTAFGSLDILVNNAGVYQFAPLEAIRETDFHWMFNTNVLGPLLTTQAAVNYFGPDGGSVINIGSAVTKLNPPESTVYSATKAALDTITRVLSKELAPKKIRVNSINPGAVETEGAHAMGIIDSEYGNRVIAMTPLGRMGQPTDIAPLAVFLASPDSYWLTGETLIASGGIR